MMDHLPLAGDHFQGLGDRLTDLAQPVAATAITSRWPRHDHALPRQMLGERLACRAFALIGGDRCRLGGSPLGRDFVLAGRALHFLERELHLVEDARRALRARPIKLAFVLLDHQLLMRDEGRVIGGLGSGLGQLGFYLQQSCLQRVDVIGQLRGIACHRRRKITASLPSQSPWQ